MRKKIHQVNKAIKSFSILHKFCNSDLDKFLLLLREGVYPYEDMDSWEKLMKLRYHLKKLFTAN